MIVACGEALIDFLPRKGEDGAPVFQPFVGGSLFNVAVALGRLGAPAGFFSGLSTDFFGTMLIGSLHDSGVDTTLCDISDRPTTLAFVSLTEGQARYAIFDEGSAGRMLTENDLPALPVAVTALHFGSFSLAAEPCGSAYETMMQNEHPHRVVSLDPNIRPSLIKNRDGYLDRLRRLVAMADIVKLSQDDLDWIAPGVSFEKLAADWMELGASLVILTRGDQGATAIGKRRSVFVRSVEVEVADTIGAGDTFSAGILARLHGLGRLDKKSIRSLSEDDLTGVLSYAAKAAAITASRPGADPPWAREMGDAWHH
jgi:fructokinase